MTNTLIMIPTGIPLTEGTTKRDVVPFSIRNSSVAYKFGKCKGRLVLIILIWAFVGSRIPGERSPCGRLPPNLDRPDITVQPVQDFAHDVLKRGHVSTVELHMPLLSLGCAE